MPASYLEAISADEVAGESHGRCLEHNVLWPEVQGRVGRGELNGELGQHPVAVRSAGGTEDLPKGWQVRRIDDVDGVLGHLRQSFGDLADGHALTLGEGNHPIGVVGIDDARPGESHLASDLESLRPDLDSPHVVSRVEDARAVDHRVGHGIEIADASAFWRTDGDRRNQQTADRVPEVMADVDNVVAFGAQVQVSEAPTDVPVAQQTRPAALQLGGVRALSSFRSRMSFMAVARFSVRRQGQGASAPKPASATCMSSL